MEVGFRRREKGPRWTTTDDLTPFIFPPPKKKKNSQRNSRKCFDSADYAMTLNAVASGELPADAAGAGLHPHPHPGVHGARPTAPTRGSCTG